MMKLKFKHQAYQAEAVNAVIECFKGQKRHEGILYRVDPGIQSNGQMDMFDESGFKNADLDIGEAQILKNIQAIQKKQNIPVSAHLSKNAIAPVNLDIEMETGTGKTYCYIKTIFEMYKQYGWSKFIIIVPSIAIREGVYKSSQITSEHFLEQYGKKAKFFIYNSKDLKDIESFSSDAGVNVMIINIHAFNAKTKERLVIYDTPDRFHNRRPIDVIKANRPILILDEPQKMEGGKTLNSLEEFNALMVLRYSATHKTTHNKIYRLDALDAYNQKLVKKISVRGITVNGLSGTNAYLYLESIELSTSAPIARIEFEVKQKTGLIKRIIKKLKKGDNLFDHSNGLAEYDGYVISDINAITDTVSFTNGVEISAGEALGNVNESTLRRIQIREAIRAHIEKEQTLFYQGIKVLTLFFIDEVAKYRKYDEHSQVDGDYAEMFMEEYQACLDDLDLSDRHEYQKYLNQHDVNQIHNGYFSIDKKTKQYVDPKTNRDKETDDVDAYDLILKDKERLLSFDEPVRFIFSHSALREGWDNPNVFVICALKHSDNQISRRQEVGRGLRLAVNQHGERQDHPSTVHEINRLTVVASESYKEFVSALQKDISESLTERARKASVDYFTGKVIIQNNQQHELSLSEAKDIYHYLIKHDYIDTDDSITQKFHDDLECGTLVEFPESLSAIADQVVELIKGVYSDALLPSIVNDRKFKINPLNENFHKKEFKELWNRINQKVTYNVHFDSNELIQKCVAELNKNLKVSPLSYTIQTGEQLDTYSTDELKQQKGFILKETSSHYENRDTESKVRYDLVGSVVDNTQLTRKTIATILSKIEQKTFAKFKQNPEEFISQATKIINDQKASQVIEHLAYDTLNDKHDLDIFTGAQIKEDFSLAGTPLRSHIYDYVITDSDVERKFVEELDTSSEVVVYAKLPRGFTIPTPVGDYNPDWAIAFKEGAVKHIYFVAETKGTLSSMQLREIEHHKINCARKFFHRLNKNINENKVRYDVIDSFSALMEVVGSS
ncbi:TPA: DEAD/DEAH box helicase family protein [Legionella pneumophila]|uniref:type III restriction-modification system endonuclease n=1 Tax=Legionella pneumophila TaxID=446 RepID=UPI001C19F29C|nr:DEAD/DEAH box helicase family protein [Legionella pneumophila]HBD7328262.1 DEAD/DEAH box helicase family protein [Legionella pneumophila]HBD9285587.1 DEAD/DEAH box helicase family protein [Legionella pneumophila]HCU6000770.1 DEAD/DEAH box helicase family protein [Legionella pneumophila]HCU6109726.1 DEAD/DEAH box helicase family protein [Legionella pneumophila]HDU8594205.1 DEAD/DEAH box helicase family protein [Legionella pneumophila]